MSPANYDIIANHNRAYRNLLFIKSFHGFIKSCTHEMVIFVLRHYLTECGLNVGKIPEFSCPLWGKKKGGD
jgi:hypothetical protein